MEYCNLMERGVIDPAKVTINAIENSASVAGLVLTTECLVTEIPIRMTEEDKQRMFDSNKTWQLVWDLVSLIINLLSVPF
jgi:chaperonin GroEL